MLDFVLQYPVGSVIGFALATALLVSLVSRFFDGDDFGGARPL